MSFELEGKIHKVMDIVTKGDFQSREFVIETPGDYPQLIKFQLVKDNCDKINPGNEGKSVKVWFDIRGRAWESKFFTNLQAWNIEISDMPF